MTITITVTGRIGGNNITWSRTASVEGLLGAVHRVGEGVVEQQQIHAMASEASGTGVGLYSTGAAVCCVVQNGEGTTTSLDIYDTANNSYKGPLLPEGMPFIVYNGAGAGGFNGGINRSATSTDTPTIDIDYILVQSISGHAPWSSLTGLKLIS
jgi:hypothetical protein